MTAPGLVERGSTVIAALAQHPDLPELSSVTIATATECRASVGNDFSSAARGIGAWAAAFGTPVVLDMSLSGWLRTAVNLSGAPLIIERAMSERDAYSLGAALGIQPRPDDEVEVTAERLLGALSASQPGGDQR